MSENSTVARPYAKAVHDIAQERGQADAWSTLLELGAAAAADEGFQRLLGSPEHTQAALADLIIGICGEQADELGRNFFRVLAENERLGCLPEIQLEYERLRAEAENVVDVEISSAVPLSDGQRETYAASLRQKLGKTVRLHCGIDETLLGGAVIRAGDLVIDGSLRGRLERLASAVKH
jgi:F-type H+-transporting ATPase subunit delta